MPFSYAEVVSSTIQGKRYVLSSVNATSPLTIAAQTTISASYTTQYQVSFNMNPIDGGTISPSVAMNVWVDAGDVSLYAMPNEGYEFSSWNATGAITLRSRSPSSNSTTATVNGAGTIIANFSAVPVPYPSLTLIIAFAVIIVVILISAAIAFRRYKRKPHN